MKSTSSIIYEFVRELALGEKFTAYQLYQLTECDGATHSAVCGILHRLTRAGMLAVISKEPVDSTRPQYVFQVIDPSITVSVIETKKTGHGFTRHDTERHPLFEG